MGKKKNKNKVAGAVKTAAKTEKKLANKLKKELATLGEEDIAKVIAEIEKEEAKRSTAIEKILPGPPTARAYASLTPHPTNNELIMFGGEYHDGQTTQVYNDLLFFNPEKNSWRQIKAPGAPPPRSAHQAIATPANKGELWIFGGEFTSPTETQFHHYKDLWCFSLADKKWEKVSAANGPCARSGHRMALRGRRLVVFGGYCDDARGCRYFGDVHAFCLDTRQWAALGNAAGRPPAPRSAGLLLPAGDDGLIVYGGFSRVREGRTELTLTHTDMFRLSPRGGGSVGSGGPTSSGGSAGSGGSDGAGYAWRSLSGGPLAPPARAGQAAAVVPHAHKAYVFGGVSDVEETEEELRGEMTDELLMLDLETGKWHEVAMRGDREGKPARAQPADADQETKEDTVTVVTDEVFTMRVGGAPATTPHGTTPHEATPREATPRPPGPCARMSAAMAVQRSTLYLYGGLLERADKQFYLGDMYSLDLHKMNGWKTIIEQPSLPAWLGSDSEEEDTESGSESEESDDSDEDV